MLCSKCGTAEVQWPPNLEDATGKTGGIFSISPLQSPGTLNKNNLLNIAAAVITLIISAFLFEPNNTLKDKVDEFTVWHNLLGADEETRQHELQSYRELKEAKRAAKSHDKPFPARELTREQREYPSISKLTENYSPTMQRLIARTKITRGREVTSDLFSEDIHNLDLVDEDTSINQHRSQISCTDLCSARFENLGTSYNNFLARFSYQIEPQRSASDYDIIITFKRFEDDEHDLNFSFTPRGEGFLGRPELIINSNWDDKFRNDLESEPGVFELLVVGNSSFVVLDGEIVHQHHPEKRKAPSYSNRVRLLTDAGAVHTFSDFQIIDIY